MSACKFSQAFKFTLLYFVTATLFMGMTTRQSFGQNNTELGSILSSSLSVIEKLQNNKDISFSNLEAESEFNKALLDISRIAEKVNADPNESFTRSDLNRKIQELRILQDTIEFYIKDRGMFYQVLSDYDVELDLRNHSPLVSILSKYKDIFNYDFGEKIVVQVSDKDQKWAQLKILGKEYFLRLEALREVYGENNSVAPFYEWAIHHSNIYRKATSFPGPTEILLVK